MSVQALKIAIISEEFIHFVERRSLIFENNIIRTTHHNKASNTYCTVLSVSNSMYPQWLIVNCTEKFEVYFVHIVCMKSVNNLKSLQLSNNLTQCGTRYILYKAHCYLLLGSHDTTRKKAQITANTSQSFDTILEYLSLVSENNLQFRYSMTSKQFNKITKRMEICGTTGKPKTKLVDILSESLSSTKKIFEMQTVNCSDGRLVSLFYVYGKKINCGSSFVVSDSNSNTQHCQKPSTNLSCPLLHYTSKYGCCQPYNTKCHNSLGQKCEFHVSLVHSASSVHTMTTLFSNQSSRVIEKQPGQRDIFTDCKAQEINNILMNSMFFLGHCDDPEKIQCTYGCMQCFYIHKLCVYELSNGGRLMHCPSGAHLKNCEKMECSNMLKCFKSYCVPYRLVNLQNLDLKLYIF